MRRSGSKAVKKSHEFYGFAPRKMKNMDVKIQEAFLIGGCAQVNYVSDKFDGEFREYYHRFKRGARVYVVLPKQKNGDTMLIIRGKFKVTADGIIG